LLVMPLDRILSETRAILDACLDAVITADEHGVITSWNAQAEAIFGWTAAETAGRLLVDTIIPPQYRAAHSAGLERFRATGDGPILGRRIEITALHRSGHEIPVELTVTAIRREGTAAFCAFVRDIRERREAEALLES